MVMHPFKIAAKGKGFGGLFARFGSVWGRYGFSPGKMDQTLEHFTEVLNQYGAGGTFPITAVNLSRNSLDIKKYQSKKIEFAIHGFFHTDYSKLPIETQIAHIEKSIELFQELGVICSGFRSPYLRWNQDTLSAVSDGNLIYDSSQGLAWDLCGETDSPAYQHVLKFYRAESASDYPSLPRIYNGLVRFPYCLPDDEALVERFQINAAEQNSNIWLSILLETHQRGELFTLGLHPERIYLCETFLKETLEMALDLSPKVWIARLDEIAQWWNSLNETRVCLESVDNNEFNFTSDGPDALVFLTQGVELLTDHQDWDGKYNLVERSSIKVRSKVKPIIGVSLSSAPQLAEFLHQQGFIFELVGDSRSHSIFLHYPIFAREDERALLSQLDESKLPLVRVGRWPNGARSALCVTGDIDALTYWDYLHRILGN